MDIDRIVFDSTPFTERFGHWVQSEQVAAWGDVLRDPAVYTPLVMAITCTFVLFGLFVWERRVKGEVPMGKLQISAKRAIKIADHITNIVEDLRFRDLISKNDKLTIYRFFHEATGIDDLVPNKAAAVKGKVAKRLGNGAYKNQPNIPGEPPLTMEEISERRVKPLPKRKPKAKYSGILALQAH